MKVDWLTKFSIGTPRPPTNVSASLHHPASDSASWDESSLPFHGLICLDFEVLEPVWSHPPRRNLMIAVGIDVSKSKSTVAVIDSNGVVLASPYTIARTSRTCKVSKGAERARHHSDGIHRPLSLSCAEAAPVGGLSCVPHQSVPNEKIRRYRNPQGQNR